MTQHVADGGDGVAIPPIHLRIQFQVHGRFHGKFRITRGEVGHRQTFGLGKTLHGLIDKNVGTHMMRTI